MSAVFTDMGCAVALYLSVPSRTVVRLFLEPLWFEFVPIFHRLQGRLAAQGGLRQLLVVEPDVAVQRGLQFFA
jgi:hypothetical protein